MKVTKIKIKIIESSGYTKPLEEKVNEFIADKEVIDIKLSTFYRMSNYKEIPATVALITYTDK